MIRQLQLVPIVEGYGEVPAVPILLRRIVDAYVPETFATVLAPIRVSRSKLVKPGELERAVQLAINKLDGSEGAILVIVDADDDCPADLGPALLARATAVHPGFPMSVVLANREYEAWFLAAAESLAGHRGLAAPLAPPADPEAIRGAKGWLDRQMPRGYREVLDQPALTAVMNLAAARTAASFDKLCRDVVRVAAAA